MEAGETDLPLASLRQRLKERPMARVGRKPRGWKLLKEFQGGARSKLRFTAILRTMSGEYTVAQACKELGIGQSRFFDLRRQWLQDALVLLDSKPMGRPPNQTAEDVRVAELEKQNHELRQRLMKAELKHELVVLKLAEKSEKHQGGRRKKKVRGK